MKQSILKSASIVALVFGLAVLTPESAYAWRGGHGWRGYGGHHHHRQYQYGPRYYQPRRVYYHHYYGGPRYYPPQPRYTREVHNYYYGDYPRGGYYGGGYGYRPYDYGYRPYGYGYDRGGYGYDRRHSVLPVLFGGVIGGVLGNQLGYGDPLYTGVGAVAGSVLGHELSD
ncbi:MAG: hypothetical protein ACREWG_03330 [Gammaproteobacteria bacterium]